jgi:1-deoxy-D-xylulose-5-phosphate reductoisomerase
MQLAYAAGRRGGTMPAVLNAANEKAVELFLNGKISFVQIPQLIEMACDRHNYVSQPGLDDIIDADTWARQAVLENLLAIAR